MPFNTALTRKLGIKGTRKARRPSEKPESKR